MKRFNWFTLAATSGLLGVLMFRMSAVAQDTAGAGEPAPDGLLDIVFSGGLTGMAILILLLGLSLTAVYLVVDHILTLRASEIMPVDLGVQLRELLSSGKYREADAVCRETPCFLSFVISHGLGELEGGWSAVEKAMEDAMAEQSARLFRKIEYLSVIGNIAPMVGLLGTVTGMIFAFQQVAATQGGAGAGDLAEGIYQALVTTVGGLIVAIPSLGAFAIFRNRVDHLVAEASYVAQHTMSPVKRAARSRGKQRSTPAAPPVQS
ncbi:MAG: MotA/TolQ/ExbB proton channel family protein [Pirellulaceae bacterium]